MKKESRRLKRRRGFFSPDIWNNTLFKLPLHLRIKKTIICDTLT